MRLGRQTRPISLRGRGQLLDPLCKWPVPLTAISTLSLIRDAALFPCRKCAFTALAKPRAFDRRRFASHAAFMRIPSCCHNGEGSSRRPLPQISPNPVVRSGQETERAIRYLKIAEFDASALFRHGSAPLLSSHQPARDPSFRTGRPSPWAAGTFPACGNDHPFPIFPRIESFRCFCPLGGQFKNTSGHAEPQPMRGKVPRQDPLYRPVLERQRSPRPCLATRGRAAGRRILHLVPAQAARTLD